MRERDLITSIAAKAGRNLPRLLAGIGDDCAVFRPKAGEDWLVTTDMLIEHVHFDSRWHSPYLLGRKSFAVNISDIAAMAGMPRFSLLAIGLPASSDAGWMEQYMEGAVSILDEFGCGLIGGDTVSSSQLTISITVLGTVRQGMAIGRDGARPGDSVYVSGPLGSAAAGLSICRNDELSVADTQQCRWRELIRRHLDPSPRVELASHLGASGLVTAMQDISDGIATDLSHICAASGVAATLAAESVPAHPELAAFCRERALEPLDFQLRGGEDYELVFTVRSGDEEQLERELARLNAGPIFRIGSIEEGQGVHLLTPAGERLEISYQGYEHSS